MQPDRLTVLHLRRDAGQVANTAGKADPSGPEGSSYAISQHL